MKTEGVNRPEKNFSQIVPSNRCQSFSHIEHSTGGKLRRKKSFLIFYSIIERKLFICCEEEKMRENSHENRPQEKQGFNRL